MKKIGIQYINFIKENNLMEIQGKFDSKPFLVFTPDKTKLFFLELSQYFSNNL